MILFDAVPLNARLTEPRRKRNASRASTSPRRECQWDVDESYAPGLANAHLSSFLCDTDRKDACRGGVWSKIPRFYPNESAFDHAPDKRPNFAIVDRFYDVDAGDRATLATRARTSRWQESHALR
ncbi:unnamed protein product, partial [Phaeothamnion confervicola]